MSQSERASYQSAVRQAVTRAVAPGTRLHTPVGQAPFEVQTLDERGVVMLFGRQRTPTRLSWESLQGALDFVAEQGTVRIGGTYSLDVDPDTLDGYLRGHVKRATGPWVASLLEHEHAQLVTIDRSRPARLTAV